MKKIIFAGMGLLFTAVVSTGQAEEAAMAKAVMKGTAPDSTIEGVVALMETPEGLKVEAHISNVPDPGEHGFHIHENGSCEDMGKAAGGHFNPGKVDHGLLPKDGHSHAHAGDMGNIIVDENGHAHLSVTLPDVGLVNGKYNVAGLTVILHEKKDDFGQPVGNAGGRIACGIIEVEK